MKRIVIPAGMAALLLAGCSMSTNPDERGIEYNAGPITSVSFSNCIDPGAREYRGPMDRQFRYPAGQRTYQFQGDGNGADAPAYKVAVEGTDRVNAAGETIASESTVEVTQAGTLTFTLNLSDCETFQRFHEQIGLKYGAAEDGFSDEEWARFLDVYLGGPLNRALNRAADGQDWASLYSDPAQVAAFEERAVELLPELVEQQAGGPYFGDFKLQLSRPDLPENLINALAATEEAIQQNKAQQERNVQVASELEAIRELVAVLGPDGYNTYQAIKDGKISVLPIPQGSGVVVAPQGQP